MKPVERIEKLIKKRRYKANSETYDKALESFLQAVDDHIRQKTAPLEPNIWRKIMASKITKLATALVILIGGVIVINLSGGSMDVASVSFAQISENMRQMPWLHVIVEGDGSRLEAWFCFERRIMIIKAPNGEIRCQDDLKQAVQVYNSEADTVTISRGSPDSLAGMGTTALDFPEAILKLFDNANDKDIQQKKSQYKGEDVKIYKMSGLLGGMDMRIEMIVDAQKSILLFLNQKAYDKTGKLVIEANAFFDYPETGPDTIYDVGVSATTKIIHPEQEKEKSAFDKAFEEAIVVIDSRESWPEPRDLVIAYWTKRNAKKYEDLAIFWPGSATWNRRALENEKPVEYVFGEAKTMETQGSLIVPYASKSYFDKHGTYGLRMRLRNDKSSKGRYYIVSGN